MAFFSIIIPLYNKELYISNTLDSVLQQDFEDFEIIIVNDGSTDSSEEIVMNYKDDRIRYFKQENAGVSTARNFGISQATSDYISFIDADDYWYPTFLSKFKQLIERYSEEKIFAAAIELETELKTIPAEYSISKSIAKDIYLEDYFEGSLLHTLICTSCAVFHRSIFDEVGVFDVSIPSGQDVDLWIRMGLKHKVLFYNKILATYVYDQNSLSRNTAFKTIKLKYDHYTELETQHAALKHFLDLNRYSEALNNKLLGNTANFKHLKNKIDSKHLSLKKYVLLHSPSFMLHFLLKLQPILIRLGLRKTFYK